MRKKEQLLKYALLLAALFGMLACYGPFRNTGENEEETNSIPEEAAVQQEPGQVEAEEAQEPEEEIDTPDDEFVQAEQPETTTPELPGVNFEGIQFYYDPSLAQEIAPKIVEATSLQEDGPWWGAEPRHVRFDLKGYPLQGTFHEAYILVYPADEFANISESGKVIVDLMKTTLADRSEDPEQLPFLPLFNAGALIRAQFKYFDFQNGSGFRYVTQFGQATNEINNHELFYTFQGLTADQQYYVAAVLPLNSPLLPDQSTLDMDNYMQFEENFQTYIADLKVKMNAEEPEQFNPSLVKIDALFESMLVEQK
jgi:hypothetical protein